LPERSTNRGLEQVVCGEYDENVERLPFQASEVYAIWQAMKPAEAAGGEGTDGGGARQPWKFSTASKGHYPRPHRRLRRPLRPHRREDRADPAATNLAATRSFRFGLEPVV
jgi:hypothetical protein